MRYVSTRGSAPALGFSDTLLTGLASDGGLYVPEQWPALAAPTETGSSRSYVDIAVDVMAPFVAGSLNPDELRGLAAEAYATFDHPEVTPLVQLDDTTWILELFHGPTLAFKDVALQLLGRLFDFELGRRGERVTIVGATSGDTGSAAIEACRDREAMDVFIMHPRGRVSDVQRRQMTTVDADNVFNIAVDGTFDDCQDLVKAMFADEAFRRSCRLSAVNSINWARVMAQTVYFVVASERLVGRRSPLTFAVPTGNFGNVFAAHGARSMGLPVNRLVVASNHNDILTRLFTTGTMEIREVTATLSPAMDIQVSSNLERLLFEVGGRDGAALADAMLRFREDGEMSLAPESLATLGETWSAARVDDEQTLSTIADVHASTGMTVDPHTAVGIAAARAVGSPTGTPVVVAATAHPAKFGDAVEKATGRRPALPERLADLFERPEIVTELPADLAVVEDFVRARTRVQ
ncbi:MAG: threonine synthase [Acidimicrobiales bacterium]